MSEPDRPPAGSLSVAHWAGIVGRLEAMLRSGRTLLLLSDFDGTLTPIVRDPAEARPPARLREDLRTLATCERVVLGVVSGRGLDDLRARVGLPSIIYVACHGLEIASPDLAFQHDEAAAQRGALASLADELDGRTADVDGVLVERKGLALAVHYRNASPRALTRLIAMIDDLLRGRPGYRVLAGRKALEILPACDWDKGRAVRWVAAQVERRMGDRVTPVYLGHDTSDERVFAALHGRGVTVRVGGTAATRAAYRVQSADQVWRMFGELADRVAAGPAR